jgi:hypothetical protein
MIDGRQEKNAMDSKIFSGFVLGRQKQPKMVRLPLLGNEFVTRVYFIV